MRKFAVQLQFIIILTIILLSMRGAVHPDVILSGSSHNETSLINNNGATKYGNRSELRLKIASLSDGAKLVAELNFYMLYGYLASLASQMDYSQLDTPGLNDNLGTATSKLLKDGLFYLDRLYLKLPVSRADVILGKQRIAWGSGIVFSPTDNFNKPNPLSLSGRKEGINALVTKVFIGDLSAFDLVIAPADVFKRIDDEINLEHLKYSKLASRLTFNKFKTDMACSYQYDGELKKYLFGLDIKGDLKLGYHLETVFIYNRDEFDFGKMANYWQAVLGLDYSFAGKWILLGEYFYNGPGETEAAELSASSFSLLDEFKYRHYLYSQISYQHDIFLGADLFLLWNMVDRSFILSPNMKYSLFQNTDLSLYSQMFLGDETDEYGPERLGINQIYYLKLTTKF